MKKTVRTALTPHTGPHTTTKTHFENWEVQTCQTDWVIHIPVSISTDERAQRTRRFQNFHHTQG